MTPSRILPALVLLACLPLHAADQPQWGAAWGRNMVSKEKNLPAEFSVSNRMNIRWSARLGTESYSTPVVAGGKVFIGTNNGEPRDPKHQGDRGVFMCFEEATGSLLWQLVVPKREEDPYLDWPKSGMSSPATVEGNRVYMVSNRGEVMCLDANGLRDGNDGPYQDEALHMTELGVQPLKLGELDADIIWMLNLTEAAGIWSHDGAHSSILIDGDFLYLNSGTGVDNTHKKIRTPDAPGLVVVDKKTGRLLARDREKTAPETFHCTWSSPSLGVIDRRKTIFFAAGNGMLYGFEPLTKKLAAGEVATLKKVWQFDFDPSAPKQEVHRFNSNKREGPSNFYGMPVFEKGRIFLAGGGDIFWGKNEAWLKCIEPSLKQGGGGEIQTNVVWSYPLEKHVLSTPAILNDLIFITDAGRKVHCLEIKTGKPFWVHETDGEFWGSPMVADGKLFVGTRRGDFWIFEAEKEKKVLCRTQLGSPVSATPMAANNTLYLSTMRDLYAVGFPRNPDRSRTNHR